VLHRSDGGGGGGMLGRHTVDCGRRLPAIGWDEIKRRGLVGAVGSVVEG
jgi:hypothetical protein